MAFVTDSDVAAGFISHWLSTTALNAIIPYTSIYRGRLPDGYTPPYCRLTVTEGSREFFSGPAYLTEFDVQCECYTCADPPVAGTLRAALDAAFMASSTDNTAGGLAVSNATVIFTEALAGARSAPTGTRINNVDVVKVVATFRITLQGNRG